VRFVAGAMKGWKNTHEAIILNEAGGNRLDNENAPVPRPRASETHDAKWTKLTARQHGAFGRGQDYEADVHLLSWVGSVPSSQAAAVGAGPMRSLDKALKLRG